MKRLSLVVSTLVFFTGLNLAAFAWITPSQHAITADGDLLIEGENIQVGGSVHATGRVTLRGNISIQGAVEAGKDIVVEGNVTAGRLIQRAGRTTFPVVDFATLKQRAALVWPGNIELPRSVSSSARFTLKGHLRPPIHLATERWSRRVTSPYSPG